MTTMEQRLMASIPANTLTHLELTRKDGRTTRLLARVEHGRLFIYRFVPAYKGADLKVWSVYRWKGNEGEWLRNAMRTVENAECEAAASTAPMLIYLDL